MTWKEIKEKIEELGVKDEDEVSYIDIASDIYNVDDITTNQTLGEWEISN